MTKYIYCLLTLFLFSSFQNNFSQDAYILVDYMKVHPANEQEYLKVEQEWKVVHRKKIAEGMISGWQLWRKLYAGEDDPYQYITITWYDNFAQTNIKYPVDFWANLMTQNEMNELLKRTNSSRSMAKRALSHRIMEANNSSHAQYLIINRMRVTPGIENEYIDMERRIWKPIQEESIHRGFKSHWAIWESFPYAENQPRYTAIDGFENFSQIGTGDETLLRMVHPEMSWDEIDGKARKLRTMASTEIWELVDSLFPENN